MTYVCYVNSNQVIILEFVFSVQDVELIAQV